MLDSLRKKPISRKLPSAHRKALFDPVALWIGFRSRCVSWESNSILIISPRFWVVHRRRRSGRADLFRRGSRIPPGGRWPFTIESKSLRESDDVEDGSRRLSERLPSDPELWASLTRLYQVEVFYGLFLAISNRGFGLSAEVSRLLADRHLDIGLICILMYQKAHDPGNAVSGK
jgi:hypothetical protein